jgi:hypothetical protein
VTLRAGTVLTLAVMRLWRWRGLRVRRMRIGGVGPIGRSAPRRALRSAIGDRRRRAGKAGNLGGGIIGLGCGRCAGERQRLVAAGRGALASLRAFDAGASRISPHHSALVGNRESAAIAAISAALVDELLLATPATAAVVLRRIWLSEGRLT